MTSRSWSAFLLLALLTFLNLLNFVDRSLIGSLSPLMKEDLGLTNTQIGLLTGLFFVALYTMMGLVMGAFADRFNRPKIIAGGLFVWSFLTAASGLAANFYHLAACRLFVGVGEASLTPPSLSMLSDKFPPARRGFAAGVYYAGIPLGVGVSLLVAGTIGSRWGWRSCFYVLGALGVVVSGLIALLLKDPARGAMELTGDAQPETEHPSFKEIMGDVKTALRRSPALVMTIVGSSFVIFSLQAGVLDQLWLVNERGYSQKDAAIIFGLLFICSGTVGNLLGGVIADWFHSRWKGGRLLFLGWMQIVVLPLTLLGRFVTPDTPLFYLCSFLGGMSAMMVFGPCFATVQDLVPIRVRSTIIAVLIFGHNFIGVAPGGFSVGFIADKLTAMGMEQPYTWSLFATGLVALLSMPMFFYGARCYARDIERMHAAEAGG